MKLIIKNLKQVVHEVEVKDNKITVKELKQEVEKVQTDFDIPIPLVKSVIKRVRDISKYL